MHKSPEIFSNVPATRKHFAPKLCNCNELTRKSIKTTRLVGRHTGHYLAQVHNPQDLFFQVKIQKIQFEKRLKLKSCRILRGHEFWVFFSFFHRRMNVK